MQMKDFFILVLIPRVYGSLPPRPAHPPVALASLNGWSLSQNGAKLHKKYISVKVATIPFKDFFVS